MAFCGDGDELSEHERLEIIQACMLCRVLCLNVMATL